MGSRENSWPDGMVGAGGGQRFRFVLRKVSVFGENPLETVMHGTKGLGALVLLLGGAAVTRMRVAADTVPTTGCDRLWHAFTPST